MSVGELVALGILVVIWIHSLLKINEQQCSLKEEPIWKEETMVLEKMIDELYGLSKKL